MGKKVTVTSPAFTGEPAETPAAPVAPEAEAPKAPEAAPAAQPPALPEGVEVLKIDGKYRKVRISKNANGDNVVEYLD